MVPAHFNIALLVPPQNNFLLAVLVFLLVLDNPQPIYYVLQLPHHPPPPLALAYLVFLLDLDPLTATVIGEVDRIQVGEGQTHRVCLCPSFRYRRLADCWSQIHPLPLTIWVGACLQPFAWHFGIPLVVQYVTVGLSRWVLVSHRMCIYNERAC
jgi:hypothetical protein